ncbi:MAG: flagellar biosynthetic protein FliR [Defluviitaleaceae bacterium]|nr:flagellar biosynthetic protein FliR [Defluviitaleaceae bacterium]MCL2264113.1 flagellar biosynthetic protein FliR [Defluviitaleaceae bacterium]
MYMELLPLLIDFFNNIDVLMLILVRVSAFMVSLPVLSGMSIPLQARLFFAFILSTAIYSSGLVETVTYHDTVSGFIMLIVAEAMTGALMGFVLFFVFNIILFAGHFIDFSMSFAMVNVMDPIQQIQVPIMGNLLFMLANAVLVVAGGLHIFLRYFFASFRLVPIGTAFILGNYPIADFMVTTFVGFVITGISLALPLIGTMLVIDVCLGVMVKAVPQMNVFVVGMPLKVMVGLFLVFAVLVPNFDVIYARIFDMALDNFLSFMEGIGPYEPIAP